MKTINVMHGPQDATALIFGCMRMPSLSFDEAARMITTAVDQGITYFDNATCYTEGEAENRFGDALAQTGIKREDIFIQSKVGLEFQRNEFDWSKDNILTNVDASLRRMKTDYLDSLLLHRPDVLFDPEEVAEAFDELEKAGKVRYFGVSNVPSMQIELLKKYVKQPLVFNQLQLSLEQSQLIDQALYLNNKTTDMSIDRDNGTLDYCRLHDITIQAWSPLQFGMFGGTFIDHPDFPEPNQALQELANKYKVTKAAIAIAWILRHPANMQAIVTDIVIAIEESCRPVVESLSELNFEAEKLYLSNILTAVEDNRSVLTQLLMLPQEDFSKQVQAMIITALTQNVGGWEKQVSLDYIHYFAGGITSFISYWLTQTSYDLDQAVEALVAVTLGHWKATEKIVRMLL